MNKIDFAIGIGGENGQGIASTGNILALIFARRGLHLNAYNAYQSIIRGGHTFLTIRAGDGPVRNMKPLGRMPPMLLVHGQRDHRVPYKKYVQPLFTYLDQHNIAYESRVFPTQGHKFKPTELEDVRTQAMEFFRQHLKPAVTTTALSQRPG